MTAINSLLFIGYLLLIIQRYIAKREIISMQHYKPDHTTVE